MHNVTTAREIALTPNASDSLRTLAWAALKTARGQTIRQSRLVAMQRNRRAA